jgi:hypothetical protein
MRTINIMDARLVAKVVGHMIIIMVASGGLNIDDHVFGIIT